MNTFIEMYNASDYPSWEAAENHGAVYISFVHSVDDPLNEPGKSFCYDMMEAAYNAARMMDGNANIETRVVRRAV
jgi:hypothetical protein